MTSATYDVVIVGGGVSGTALLYSLSHFTDIQSIALLEKYDELATVSSRGSNNSQTIHCGDIETNYSLEKAITVQRAADMLRNYACGLEEERRDNIVFKYPKMVLGVGESECDLLRERFNAFKPHFPNMELLEKEQIAELEPTVAMRDGKLREEALVALGSRDEYSAVDFAALSRSFVDESLKVSDKKVELKLGTRVIDIEKQNDVFQINTDDGQITARAVVVCACGHSLLLAQQMGYGLNFSCLPMAGSFYYTPEVLKGKVYTVQNDALPFAAIHGDPDVLVEGKTRFGPTALALPVLERYNIKTLPEFLRVLKLDLKVLKVFGDLLKVKDIRNYILKNILFEIPFIRRRVFLKDAQKIVPSLTLEDITFAKKVGGVRPQLIDKENQELLMGEARIDTGDGIIFNMTPSPGGTSCLGNAEKDLNTIVEYLGANFDKAAFEKRLLAG